MSDSAVKRIIVCGFISMARETDPSLVIPAKAGIQGIPRGTWRAGLDAPFRGHDGMGQNQGWPV